MRCAASAEACSPYRRPLLAVRGRSPYAVAAGVWTSWFSPFCFASLWDSRAIRPGSRLLSRVPPWRARGHRFGSRPSSRLQNSRARRPGRTPGRPRGLRPLGGLARFRDLRRGSLPARLGLRQFRLLSLSFDFVADASVSCRRDVSAQALWDRIQRLEEGLNHRLRAARQAGTGAIRFGHFRILRS